VVAVVLLGVTLAFGPDAGAGTNGAGASLATDRATRSVGEASPPPDPLLIRMIDQTDTVGPNGDFSAFFEVSEVPAGSSLAVDLYPRITTQAGLDAAARRAPTRSMATFPVVAIDGDPSVAPVSTGFVINLSASDAPLGPCCWSYRLTKAGVYPVRVRLRGPDKRVIQSVVTYLVRGPEPDQEVDPSTLALVVASGSDAADQGPVSADKRSALGELTASLSAHRDVPASLALNPNLVGRLASQDPSGPAMAGLRTALEPAGRELLGAPYVDLDVASLVHADLRDELKRQAERGSQVLGESLGDPTASTWLMDGRLDAESVNALGVLGVERLALPASAYRNKAPAGAFGLVGTPKTSRGTSIDPDAVMTSATDPILAAHQQFGHLAALGTVEPGATRIVLAEAGISDPQQVAEFVAAVAEPGAFFKLETMTELFDQGDDARQAELAAPQISDLGSYPGRLKEANARLDNYSSMVPGRTDLIEGPTEALAIAARADLSNRDRTARVARVQRDLDERLGAISIPATDRVTLGARDAQFPLPIRNDLGYPVRVRIHLSAPDRLSFPAEDIEAVLEQEQTVVPIHVRTVATGDTPLTITVMSPDRGTTLSEGRYRVRSTAVSGVGILLTVGAVLFLVIWWGRHWSQSRGRHARRRLPRR